MNWGKLTPHTHTRTHTTRIRLTKKIDYLFSIIYALSILNLLKRYWTVVHAVHIHLVSKERLENFRKSNK